MTLDPRAFKGLSRFLAPSAGGPLADRALSEKLITPEQLQECMDEQDRTGRPLDVILVEKAYIREEDVQRLREPQLPREVAEVIRDPARQVAQYVLVSVLGRGGMAEVWKAWDRSLARWVAIKFLRPDVGEGTRRLEREGRMAGGLSHPNIISIFERGRHEGRSYLVMPLVEGTAPEAPLPFREASRIGVEVARALAHAHSKGVIHRDVKPANIILDRGGRVLLADFGLAIPGETATSRWAMSGTPEYASPEQVRGDALDVRTDLYSLGVTLYHLLSGKPPFAGRDAEHIADQVLKAEVAPLKGVPGPLAATVKKAMERDREQRFNSAEELAECLRRFAEPAPLAVLKRPGSILAMVLAAILSAGLTYLGLALNRMRLEERAVVEVLRGGARALSQAEQVRIDPDSNQVRVIASARKALQHFQLAARMTEGKDPEAEAGQGRCFELMGLLTRAEASYREALETEQGRRGVARIYLRRYLQGDRSADWKGLALARLERREAEVWFAAAEGDWKAVRSAGPRELQTHPYDELTHLLLGLAAHELEMPIEAKMRLETAVRLSRWDTLPQYHLGRVLASIGEKEGARRAFAAALHLKPVYPALRARITAEMKKLE